MHRAEKRRRFLEKFAVPPAGASLKADFLEVDFCVIGIARFEQIVVAYIDGQRPAVEKVPYLFAVRQLLQCKCHKSPLVEELAIARTITYRTDSDKPPGGRLNLRAMAVSGREAAMTLTTQELSDREEIRETIIRWSRAVDTSDWTLFQKSHTDDLKADFTSLGIPLMPAGELRALLQKSMDYFDVMHHILSNTTFHEVAGDSARTSTLVTATSVPKGGNPFQTLAWYHDELRRTSAGWRIFKRNCEHVYDTNPVKDFKPPALSK